MAEKSTSFHHDTGKGSRPREYSVTQAEFGKKFDAIDWSAKSATSAEPKRDIFAEIVEGFDALAEGYVETLRVSSLSSLGSSGTLTTSGVINTELWSVDAQGNTAAHPTCIKCPRDVNSHCNYCGLKQSDNSIAGWAKILQGACAVPPPGWYCTRVAGHSGPCAAHPDEHKE